MMAGKYKMVNSVALSTDRPLTVTVIFPLDAFAGTFAVNESVDAD